MENLKDAVSDYCSSEHFLFLDPDLKEHAESLLCHWCETASGSHSLSALEKGMNGIAGTNLPVNIRKRFPELLKEFFNYLSLSGKIPEAMNWKSDVELIEPNYTAKFRNDGSIKGETFRNKASFTGRNDPCPCGSGKKFKKCCMELIK